MSTTNWRTRCDWCGWPMVPHPEAGCWDGNCSLRPLPLLTPAQQQVLELKQEIRRLERERTQSGKKSTADYMDTPHFRVNRFVSAWRVMRPTMPTIDHIKGMPLFVADVETVIRDSAPLYTGECPQVVRQSSGVDAIAAERERQVTAEGWHEGHDDEHDNGSLAGAAAAYAIVAREQALGDDGPFAVPDWWAWDESWWKPKDQRRNLVRAGALIAAEIDRIDRAEKLRTVAGQKS